MSDAKPYEFVEALSFGAGDLRVTRLAVDRARFLATVHQRDEWKARAEKHQKLYEEALERLAEEESRALIQQQRAERAEARVAELEGLPRSET